MRKSMKTILAALVLATPLALTSCEGTLDDIFGEWSRPSGNTDSTPAADHSKQYLVYSYSTALDSTWTDIPSNATVWTGTVTADNVAAGTYVVEGTATCANQLVLMGEVNLILKDGAKLTVDNGITYDRTGDAGSLNIYGQGISSSMGQLVVNNNTPFDPLGYGNVTSAIFVKALSIHGCKIETTGDTGNTGTAGEGIVIPTVTGAGDITIYNGNIKAVGAACATGIANLGTRNVNIYGGYVDAKGAAANGTMNMIGGDGIQCAGNLTIKGDAIIKAYGGAYDSPKSGGYGIKLDGTLTISDNADVYAEAGKDATAAIEAGLDLSFSGKKLVTESIGNSAGLETESLGAGSITISAGLLKITTALGPTIQSDKNVEITANVTKVEMTNNGITGTDNPASLFVTYGGTFKLGGTDISASWIVGTTLISAVTTANLQYNSNTLTYEP